MKKSLMIGILSMVGFYALNAGEFEKTVVDQILDNVNAREISSEDALALLFELSESTDPLINIQAQSAIPTLLEKKASAAEPAKPAREEASPAAASASSVQIQYSQKEILYDSDKKPRQTMGYDSFVDLAQNATKSNPLSVVLVSILNSARPNIYELSDFENIIQGSALDPITNLPFTQLRVLELNNPHGMFNYNHRQSMELNQLYSLHLKRRIEEGARDIAQSINTVALHNLLVALTSFETTPPLGIFMQKLRTGNWNAYKDGNDLLRVLSIYTD